MRSDSTQTASVQAALSAEDQRRQAMLAGDVPALQVLLADELVYVHSTAAKDTKASYLEKLQSGSLKYLSLQFEDLQARALGDCVVVSGRMETEVSKGGQSRQVRSLFMTVWSEKRNARGETVWTLGAHQGTFLPI